MRLLRIVRWCVIVGIIVSGILALAGSVYLRRSLPQYSGVVSIAGVRDSVDIIRDVDGVPHIYAQHQLDAFLGLGYVHAQDRLWQMELHRRIGQGRLSEMVGSAGVETDRLLRVLGVYRAAQSAWNAWPDEPRMIVESYITGINAYIAEHRGSRLPPEFTLLGVTPEPWVGPDVLVWAKMMAFDLGGNYMSELQLGAMIDKVGLEHAMQLFPPSPDDGVSIIQQSASQPTALPIAQNHLPFQTAPPAQATFAPLLAQASKVRAVMSAMGVSGEAIGSNSWVVDGTKSTIGKPILANDPHLAMTLPSTWYLAHLSAGELDVIGATIPGLPAVVIGHNRTIAWGITNFRADVQDLFRERLDAGGQKAEFQGQMEPMQLISETIRIKGEPDLNLTARITRHGPLISDALSTPPDDPSGDDKAAPLEPLALRWAALDPEDTTVIAFIGLNFAQDWSSFRQALDNLVAPAQNFIYADVQGNIGYYAAGRIPIRTSSTGALPNEGWSGMSEWQGWIPFSELPHVYNPPEHMIVTANNRPLQGNYPYLLGDDWDTSYRAQRITTLLNQKPKLSPDDFVAIQGDTVSMHARTLLPELLNLVDPATDEARQAIELLRAWDGNASGDSPAAALYAAWLRQLPRLLLEDDVGADLLREYQGGIEGASGRFLQHTLQRRDSPWCDNRTTQQVEDCASIVDQALDIAVSDLQQRLGADMNGWRWDELHTAVFYHQPFDDVDVLRRFFNREIANGGDWSTVNNAPFSLEYQFEQYTGPTYRQIIDLSNMDSGQFIQAIGQSGHFLSAHYDDYLVDWQTLRYLPMRLERNRIEVETSATLRLDPRP